MMKKHTIRLTLAALMLALAGCAAKNQTTETTPASADTAQTRDVSSADETTREAEPEQTEDAAEESSADTAASLKVADASQMTSVEDVVTDDMVPVAVSTLADGEYEVTVDSSSSMFHVEACTLKVADGRAEALMVMGGSGYLCVYPGTAEEAAAADEADYIEAGESAEGTNTFLLPVEALDAGVNCAAFSKNKELWYDRVLVFRADSLPLSAFAEGSFETAESLGLPDGTYTVDVTLAGGSGKASVESPCRLFVEGGEASAEIIWSSANYDYMKVDGEQIDSEIIEGRSVCLIPVAAFSHPLAVIADTTAMSVPHEIDYTLTFDAASVTPETP